jgi:hypoxanthine phosphoribosyltransferase
MRQETLTWDDVDRLIDSLLPQLTSTSAAFEAILLITRGGIVPGGLIAEALDLKHVLTAAVSFPLDIAPAKLLAWPEFLQFPDDELIAGRRTLVVDDVWGSGRTITAVKSRVEAAGGFPELCVLHYNPSRTLFTKAWPTYYAAITDARIVYPWEIDRSKGLKGVLAGPPENN